MIRIEDLNFYYKAGNGEIIPGLVGLNLEIEEGEFVGLIGPTGSGKSTLAKCLNGMIIPSNGRVLVDTLDTASIDSRWDIRQRVGIVFTNPENRLVGATVEEDVAFGLENIGMDCTLMRRRVDEALRTVRLEEYKDFPPHLLSAGQKQRLAIAGILALRPRYIVLDEATALLDPGGRREVMEVVKKLNREEGLAILLITHSMQELIFTGRVVVMEGGRKILEGLPGEVFISQELKRLGMIPPVSFRFRESLRRGGLDIREEIKIEEILEAV